MGKKVGSWEGEIKPGQRSDNRGQRAEDKGQITEFGNRTRRRPIGRDYAAAKDAEVGKIARWQKISIITVSLLIPVTSNL